MSIASRIIVSAVFVLAGISAVSAQLSPNSQVKTRIPFEFIAGDKVMPAGEYTISRINTGTGLVIRNRTGDAVIVDTILSYMAKAPETTSLDFENVEGFHVLSQVRVTGSTSANQLYRSSKSPAALAAKRGKADHDGATTIN